MWQLLIDHFRRYPAQERVVRMMIRSGISVTAEGGGRMRAGDVLLADMAVARAANVDRRIVRATVETILRDPGLAQVFTRLRPALDLQDVATRLGYGVIEVVPEDPGRPGILAAVARVVADAGLTVRQAIGEDPAFTDSARLVVVTGEPVPGGLAPALESVEGVASVAIT